MDTVEQLVDIPSIGFPSWAPHGEALAYLLDQSGGGWRIWTSDPAGAQHRAVSERAVAGVRPIWSPDGTTLAVVRGNSQGGSDIWLLDATGAGDERRLVGGAWETRSSSFAPDGKWLAFISGEAGMLDLWLVAVAGGEPKRLSGETNPLDEPRWTLAGRRMAAGSPVSPRAPGNAITTISGLSRPMASGRDRSPPG